MKQTGQQQGGPMYLSGGAMPQPAMAHAPPPPHMVAAMVPPGMVPAAAAGIIHHQMMQPQPQQPLDPAAAEHTDPAAAAGAPITNGVIIEDAPGTNGYDDDEEETEMNEENLANTKEKTPMCLINELARYNRVQHQYTLTDEQGPAHKKVFFVKLKLGEEEYASSGPSIKKAQHAAAAIALERTQYKHPPPKPTRRINGAVATFGDSITPTVRLNALVMKRGEPAVYRHIDMPRPHFNRPPNMDFRGMYNQRYHYPRYPRMFCVSLKVGQREFVGMGNSRQAARHNAAEKALSVLQHLPLPSNHGDKDVGGVAPSVPIVNETSDGGLEEEEDSDEENKGDALKSEISLVFEIALKRNFSVNFEVVKESGPPHMRVFVTRCTVDKYVTEAEGNSKKISKKRAAERMLEELQKLPSLGPSVARPKRLPVQKKKKRNLIKVTETALPRTDPNYGVGINPISRLIQIQQAKKEKEPVYTLIAERGVPRHREFVMQVQVGESTCTGAGPNKKLAKRNAAEAMLQMLGYSRPAPQPTKPALKTGESQQMSAPGGGGDKKVTFIDQDAVNPSAGRRRGDENGSSAGRLLDLSAGRQLVPGVILMPDGTRQYNQGSGGYVAGGNGGGGMRAAAGTPNYQQQTTAAVARELLETGVSPTAEVFMKASGNVASLGLDTSQMRPKDRLLYLAKVLGYTVHFTDFPKGNNKTELLSLVSLSTVPQQVSHGEGATIADSHDNAALTALHALADTYVVVAAPAPETTAADGAADKMAAAGDGSHIKSEVDRKMMNTNDLGKTAIKTELQ